MIIFLTLLVYLVIGMIAGRAWATYWFLIRGNENVGTLCGAVGMYWPVFLVFGPIGWVIYKLAPLFIPAILWSLKQVDRTVIAMSSKKVES